MCGESGQRQKFIFWGGWVVDFSRSRKRDAGQEVPRPFLFVIRSAIFTNSRPARAARRRARRFPCASHGPPGPSLYGVSETWLWRFSVVVFALPILSLLLTYPHRRRKAVGKGPPPIVFAVFVVLGSVATLAMLAWILAGLSHQPAVPHQLFHARFCLYQGTRCDHAGTGRQPTR